MKILYLECNMGAAGDMLMSALCELLPDPDAFIARMNGLGIPGVRFERSRSEKCGIVGTHIRVLINGEEEHARDVDDGDHHHDHDHEHHHDHDHDHHHEHHGMADIRAVIEGLDVPDSVKEHASAVYELIAKAESEVHGMPVDQVHFHEVGAMDAVADVVGVCLLMDLLKPDRVAASPIHVGSGQVRCAHGILPVPAPATARILQGVPTYGGAIRGELCTPTGAALIKHFAGEFGGMPVMAVSAIGCGMGAKDFEWANCVRAMLGEAGGPADEVAELACNLDDMTGEAVAYAAQALLEAGALDVWTVPIQMKKGRPAVTLCCLCPSGEEGRFADMMLRHTTTLGVRFHTLRRRMLNRESLTLDTPYGPVRAKRAYGRGVDRVKAEYEDIAAIARREDIPLSQILNDLNKGGPTHV